MVATEDTQLCAVTAVDMGVTLPQYMTVYRTRAPLTTHQGTQTAGVPMIELLMFGRARVGLRVIGDAQLTCFAIL